MIQPYQTDFASGSFAPLTWSRDQCPNGIPPLLGPDAVLTLTVQSGAYETAGGEGDVRDRCELRDPDKLPMGTPVFYGFSMRVPADFPHADARFVCAQMKGAYDADTGGSPMFALRIENGHLFATVEGLFEPGDEITLGQSDLGGPEGVILDHHDFTGTSDHQVRVVLATDPDGMPPALAPDYRSRSSLFWVRPHHPLPALDGDWHRFLLRVEPSATKDYDGLIELWCDGQPVASVTGQIGLGSGSQWFKIGPYRDKSPLWGDAPAALEFRDIRRGVVLTEVA